MKRKSIEIMEEEAKAARIRSLQEKQDRLRQQLASLEEECALVGNELASLQAPSSTEEADVAIEERVLCKHFCAHHTALLDPALWRYLPGELLQMVFSRLPLRKIVSLQCLSKAWRWNVTAKESGFRRLCGNTASDSTKMFALADEAVHGMGIVSIKLFDCETQKWHVSEMTLQPQFYCETMSASDGGLVCFVSRMLDKVSNPLLIVVMNPLTKEYKILPAPPSVSEVPPEMVQIIMDRETKCYKVVVVGKSNRGTGARLAKVYSSSTGLWSNTESVPDLVFGDYFRWKPHGRDDLTARRVRPCVYAGREAELLKLGGQKIPSPESFRVYTLLNDRLFVLHYETRPILSEYQVHTNPPYWVRVRVHDCTPFEKLSSSSLFLENSHIVLHACRDSLMITVKMHVFLYNLSTGKWQAIPAVPGDDKQHPCIQAALCELCLDAVP